MGGNAACSNRHTRASRLGSECQNTSENKGTSTSLMAAGSQDLPLEPGRRLIQSWGAGLRGPLETGRGQPTGAELAWPTGASLEGESVLLCLDGYCCALKFLRAPDNDHPREVLDHSPLCSGCLSSPVPIGLTTMT